MSKKINYEFLLLQSIGIILVVLGHKGGLSLFSEWFPIYSFHMPLFIFISGYFYRTNNEEDLKTYIVKKFKSLMIPYFVWNFIYGIIVNILLHYNIVDFGTSINFRSLFIDPWITGHQFGLNVATWFVPALFIIQIIYVALRKAFTYIKFNNEYFILSILMIIGAIGVAFANKGYTGDKYLTIVRTMFLIPFYQMGYLYKIKLENKYNINSIVYFITLFIVQFILFKKYSQLPFSAVFCNEFNRDNIFLPYLTSITGIMFWLRICKILVSSVGENKITKYIGSNTFTIMTHHQFVFFLMNLFFASTANILNLEGFNFDQFRTNIWYAYDAGDQRFLVFYVIAGVSVPLIVKLYTEKIMRNEKIQLIKSSFLSKFNKRTFNKYDLD